MKVAVIQGGPSLEAAVSRVSAAAVVKALAERGHQTQLFELGPDLALALKAMGPDLVFPAVHGAQGEDGCVQGLLEIMQLPYVGSQVRGSAIAASKVATKLVYRAAQLPVAGERVLSRADLGRDSKQLLAQLRAELGPKLIMKPAQGGSALGIVRLFETATEDEFSLGINEILAIDDAVLVEEYVLGMELTCGVLEVDGKAIALPPTMIAADAADWYDFRSKYAPGGSRHQCPAQIGEALTKAIQDAAVTAHCSLGLRDLSRTDVILKSNGQFVLLETNTLPGMTSVSLFPEAAGVYGIEFPQLIEGLCTQALRRGSSAPRPETAMPV